MQIHPVCCHYQTRPTGVPEYIVLDDSGIVAFRLFFRLGWYRSDGGEGQKPLHVFCRSK